jgi:nitrogen regulatory protein P-II 1
VHAVGAKEVKRITAVVPLPVFEAIKEALTLFGVHGMTVGEVQLSTRETGHIEIYRGRRFAIDAEPSVKIDFLVPDDELADLTRVISNIIGSDGWGGSVWTTDVNLIVRARTGEHGLDNL